jgi:hypothetical protein
MAFQYKKRPQSQDCRRRFRRDPITRNSERGDSGHQAPPLTDGDPLRERYAPPSALKRRVTLRITRDHIEGGIGRYKMVAIDRATIESPASALKKRGPVWEVG